MPRKIMGLSLFVMALWIFCLPTICKAGKATLIYHIAGSTTSLIKTVVDVSEDDSTGYPIFTCEDGSQVQIGGGDIVESLRPVNPDEGDAIISALFPTEGLVTLAGIFVNAGMNFTNMVSEACNYNLPDIDIGCPYGTHYSWSPERTWDKTASAAEKDYSFKFRFYLGVPISAYAPDPNNWILYVRNLNTFSSDDFPINNFYLRINLFGSVYMDIPKLKTGDDLLVTIPKDIFEKSGYDSSTKTSLVSDMKIEATGYQSTWFGFGKDLIATASELGPVVKVLPPTGTVDPIPFDIDFIVSDTSLTGIDNLNLATLKVMYNGIDITDVFIQGVEGGTFPYSYYVETTDESEKNRRYVVSIKDVVFSQGAHEVELSISDLQGHTASDKAIYTADGTTPTPTKAPLAPTGFNAIIDGNTVTLQWNAIHNATGYKLYAGYSSGSYTVSADLGNVTSLTFENIPEGVYYLAITSYNGCCESEFNEITVRVPSEDTCDTPLSEGLVAYYPFNGNANDESGNGNHGIVSGATLTTDRFGNANSAYYFDGIDDYINIGNSSDFDFGTENFTISLWAYFPTTPAHAKTLIGTWSGGDVGSSGDWFLMGFSGDTNIHLAFHDDYVASNHQHLISSNSITVGEWQHYVIIRNGTEVGIYNQGVKTSVSVDPGVPFSVNTNLLIGFEGNHPTEYHFLGKIDDVHIYKRALSEAEILELYK